MFYALSVSQADRDTKRASVDGYWQSHKKERVAMFLSALELRNIIESSFLPKRCQCTLSPDLSMTVKVYADGETDQLDLLRTGIDARQLNGCREINELIAILRTDLQHRHVEPLHTPAQRKAL
jgi:hypothetical protein